MRRGPDARERRAAPLHMMPVWTVHQRNGATVDLEALVPAGGLGHDNAAPRVQVSSTRQQNGEATLVRHSHHAEHGAQRPYRQATTARQRAGLDLTKYGQLTHNTLPFDGQSDRPTPCQKQVRDAAVTHVARAHVITTHGGITNAPISISRLRV